MYKKEETMKYWNAIEVESMYDKHLLEAEIRLIKRHIPMGAKILDAGCGEGEGTLAYSYIPGCTIDAVDFSDTRLDKAARRLKNRTNVTLKQVDFLGDYSLDTDYQIVISQRFLINITDWKLQQQILLDLMSLLRPGGQLLLLEGSIDGSNALNKVRELFGLAPIETKWHNSFLDDSLLLDFMKRHGYALLSETGLASYFVLTRGIRPVFDSKLNWDCDFNRIAASEQMDSLLKLDTQLSRLKLWVFKDKER